MQLMPMGEYYVWYCEWCDTRNMTLWTKIEKNRICCAACQKKFSLFQEPATARPGQNHSHHQPLAR